MIHKQTVLVTIRTGVLQLQLNEKKICLRISFEIFSQESFKTKYNIQNEVKYLHNHIYSFVSK